MLNCMPQLFFKKGKNTHRAEREGYNERTTIEGPTAERIPCTFLHCLEPSFIATERVWTYEEEEGKDNYFLAHVSS